MEKFTVYMHVNKINEKKYVGITCQNIERRWRKDGQGYRTSGYFYHAIQKYGWENFEHLVIEEGLTKEEAEQKEIELISKLDTTNLDKGYNLSNGGSVAGKHSEKTRKKMSEKAKLRKVDHSKIKKMQKLNKGRKHPKEFGEQISKRMKGRKFSDHHIERIRWSHIGYRHTEEQKRKISESIKKTVTTPEYRKKKSEIMKEVYKNNPNITKSALEKNRKKVICLTTGEVFNQIKDGAEKHGMKSASGITEVCKGRREYSGKLPDGTKLKWSYY